MLKFNAWPPEKGKIEFSPAIREEFNDDGTDRARLQEIGETVGDLLFTNMPEASAPGVFTVAAQIVVDAQVENVAACEPFFAGVTDALVTYDAFGGAK